jgi:hypothetical protein
MFILLKIYFMLINYDMYYAYIHFNSIFVDKNTENMRRIYKEKY